MSQQTKKDKTDAVNILLAEILHLPSLSVYRADKLDLRGRAHDQKTSARDGLQLVASGDAFRTGSAGGQGYDTC